jgi:hypothetical protein
MSDLADYRMYDLRSVDWTASSNRTPSGVRVTADNSMACSAYTACIRVISDAVSSLPLHLYEKLPLHTQPNPWQTAQEFRDWMTGMYLHYGASYAEIRPGARGAVSELWPLHSSRMEVERLSKTAACGICTASRTAGRRSTAKSRSLRCGSRPRTESSRSRPTGCSRTSSAWPKPWKIMPARISATVHGLVSFLRATTRFRWKRPSSCDKTGNASTVVQTVRSARACLPNGVKAHELSGSNEAAQMLESRQFSVIEICRLFRVPPHLIQELTRSTYSNIEVQGTEFVQHCLLPHLKRWEAAIARDLIVDDERYFAEHSVSGLLRGDHTSRASYYVSALQNGWMTINEVRELENLNPIDGGDVHFVPMNMQTLEQMTEEPEPAPEPEPPPPEPPAEPEPEPPAEQLDPVDDEEQD